MDEEKKEGQGEQEQESTGDKVQQAVQDAKKIANLGTALASQNYAKAAIEAVKLLKDKKFRKKLWKRLLISMLMPIISIILVASIVYAIINGVGELLSTVKDAVVDFFTIDPKEGEIVISDDKIDMIIEQIESLGIDAEDLKLTGDKVEEDDPDAEEKNKEALRKYIKKYYEASAVTENLDYYGKNNKAGDNAKVYGTIKVYKAKGNTVDESGGKQLTYKPYEEMLEMQEKDKNNIEKYFSVNESNGNLIIPKVTSINKGGEKSTYTTLSEINYKAVVSQYTTPLNFFIYLNVVSQNPEFVANLATLVKTNSEIHITLMENTTETTETTDIEYTLKSKTMGSDNTYEINEDKENQQEHKTTTTTITSTANPYITYVKTWFCEQTINYEKLIKEPVTTTNSLNYSDTEPTELVGEGETVTWKENVVGSSTTTTTTTEYVETVRSDVKETLGEKGDGEKSFIGSWDVKYKLPNTSHKEAAAGNIISGSDLLFELLNMDSGMQSLEQIMRYALYKYTGEDYGVTELDLSIFDAKEFSMLTNNASSALLKEYIRYWEHSTPPPKNADGTKYIIEDDGAGHATVGYGVDIENSGYSTRFIEAGYPINIGGEVDIEFVDAIEDEIIEKCRQQILNYTSGLNLADYQINALISRAYNCGPSGAISTLRGSPSLNFVDSYKTYWKQETDDLFELKNSNANFNHSLYTQYMSKPITSEGITMGGLERRRKSEWTLFQTGYYDVLNKWHQDGGNILDMCVQVMNDMIANNVHYSLTDLITNNIEASSNHKSYCCATYVSVVLYKSGALQPDFINKYMYNYTGTVNAGGVNTMLRDAGWTYISEEAAQPGDVCVYDGHTFIYAGGNEIWDQNSGCYQPTGGTLSQWNYYKSTYNLDIWRMP